MNLLIYALYWVSFTVLFAAGQGLLLPMLRNFAQHSKEARITDLSLHKIGFVAWLLPALLLPSWLHLAIALLVRVAVFDIVLNYAAGDKLFNVGQTAKTDKLLQWTAAKLGLSASVLSAILKVISILLLLVVVWKYCF
jgi:hypothetical protein